MDLKTATFYRLYTATDLLPCEMYKVTFIHFLTVCYIQACLV